MKVSTRGGRIRLRLERLEVRLLTSLFDELDALLMSSPEVDGTPDAVLARLFPAAYEDDLAAEEFRSLTEESLRTERGDRIGSCRADLESSADIDLTDPDVGRRWIQTLNDLRLALGTRLEINADDAQTVDRDDAQAQPRAIYYWLTAMQDRVVDALMG